MSLSRKPALRPRGALVGLGLALLGGAAQALAQGSFGAPPLTPDTRPPELNARTITYGLSRRSIALLVPRNADRAPLVVHLPRADFGREGERLSMEWLPAFLFENGFAYARISPRPEREVGVTGVLADISDAIGHLGRNAAEYRLDPGRIILLGDAAGGHFAALLGTDPSFLERAGLPFNSVRAVLALNGDGFDIPRRIATSSRFRARHYERLFGTEPSAQRELSPVTHLAAPNAPIFLFAAEEGSERMGQAEAIASLLRQSDAEVQVWPLERTIRGSLETYLGAPQHSRTSELRDFLRRAVAGGSD